MKYFQIETINLLEDFVISEICLKYKIYYFGKKKKT